MDAVEDPWYNPRAGGAPAAHSDRDRAKNGLNWISFALYNRVETRSAHFVRSSIAVATIAFDTPLATEVTLDRYCEASAMVYVTPIGNITTPPPVALGRST